MKSVQELRTKCARLVHDAPKEFASARRAFENMLPLLESDEIVSRNRGHLAILANEANKGIKEGRLVAIDDVTSRKRDFVHTIVAVGGLASVIWGYVFSEIGGWCANTLKIGGATAIIFGAGMRFKKLFDFGAKIEFPANAGSFLENLKKVVGPET